MDSYQIRWMIRRDMPDVIDIERQSFGDHAWPEEEFVHCLRQRNCIGMVAERPPAKRKEWGRIAAFMVYELHKTRLHLLNFAVHPEFRRLGVGRSMVDKLLGKLSQQRRIRISLEVREGNLDAQLFFHAMGFKAVSVLRSYYDDSDEDAYLFHYRLPVESEVTA